MFIDVTHEYEIMIRCKAMGRLPSQSNVETSFIFQETYMTVVIAAHTGDDDHILFATLKPVYGIHFNLLQI